MARITILRHGRTERVTPEHALAVIHPGGALLDGTDERGVEAWRRRVAGRPSIRWVERKGPWFSAQAPEGKIGSSQRSEVAALRLLETGNAAEDEEGEE